MKYIGLFLIAPFFSITLTKLVAKDEMDEKSLRILVVIMFLFVIGFGFIIL